LILIAFIFATKVTHLPISHSSCLLVLKHSKPQSLILLKLEFEHTWTWLTAINRQVLVSFFQLRNLLFKMRGKNKQKGFLKMSKRPPKQSRDAEEMESMSLFDNSIPSGSRWLFWTYTW